MTHLVHKLILMPQAMKIQDGMVAVDKEWEEPETTPAWQLEKVKSEKEVGNTKREKESPLCYTDGHVSPQIMRSRNQNFRSIKVESYSEVTL